MHRHKPFSQIALQSLSFGILALAGNCAPDAGRSPVDASKANQVRPTPTISQHAKTERLLQHRPSPVQHRSLARRNLWFPVYNRGIARQTRQSSDASSRAATEGMGGSGPGVASYSFINFPANFEDTSGLASRGLVRTPVEKGKSEKQLSFLLPQGTVLVRNVLPVNMKTAFHRITVRPGAIAYFVHQENDTAILNLSGERRTSVIVESTDGKQKYDVPIGGALIISKEELNNSKVSKFIPWQTPVAVASEDGMHIYRAGFAFTDALDRSSEFHDCVRSKVAADRAVANKLLKNAAASLVVPAVSAE